MKKIFFAFVFSILGYFSFAQSNTFPLNGNVGIGTNTPGSALQVSGLSILSNPAGNSYDENLRLPAAIPGDFASIALGAVPGLSGTGVGQWTIIRYPANQNYMFSLRYNSVDYLNILNNGYVGIGTTNPLYKLNIAQDITMNQDIDVAQFGISGTTDPTKRIIMGYDVNGAGFGFIKAGWYHHQWTNLVLQPQGGFVGIGTTTPDQLLSVKGTIHSQQVLVDMTGWGDFVFNATYNLASLSSLKTYLDQNHHLPDMPSEQEVIKNGINVGDMVKLQTQKIEELTLYLIEKDQQLKDQENKSIQQDARIAALEKALEKLTAANKK